MLKYMLDTDICSYIIRENPPSVLQKFKDVGVDKLCISSITLAELKFGAKKRKNKQLISKVDMFASLLETVSWCKKCATAYSTIRYNLESSGTPIGNLDILLASCSKANNLILVSNNEKHFSKIKGIKFENWI